MLFLALAIACIPAHAAKPQPELAASVLTAEGLTALEPPHMNLNPGAKLKEGDRVTVMSNSKLRLRLVTGAVLELGPHSELLLKHTLDGIPLLRVPHGELLLVSAGDQEIEVRTSQLKLRLFAKAFFLSKKLDQPAYVCICDGEAQDRKSTRLNSSHT